MARMIEWDGKPLALLVETEDGSYLVPPVVKNTDGVVIQGQEVLQAIVDTGIGAELPVVFNASPGDLAEIDRRVAHVAAKLGVRIL